MSFPLSGNSSPLPAPNSPFLSVASLQPQKGTRVTSESLGYSMEFLESDTELGKTVYSTVQAAADAVTTARQNGEPADKVNSKNATFKLLHGIAVARKVTRDEWVERARLLEGSVNELKQRLEQHDKQMSNLDEKVVKLDERTAALVFKNDADYSYVIIRHLIDTSRLRFYRGLYPFLNEFIRYFPGARRSVRDVAHTEGSAPSVPATPGSSRSGSTRLNPNAASFDPNLGKKQHAASFDPDLGKKQLSVLLTMTPGAKAVVQYGDPPEPRNEKQQSKTSSVERWVESTHRSSAHSSSAGDRLSQSGRSQSSLKPLPEGIWNEDFFKLEHAKDGFDRDKWWAFWKKVAHGKRYRYNWTSPTTGEVDMKWYYRLEEDWIKIWSTIIPVYVELLRAKADSQDTCSAEVERSSRIAGHITKLFTPQGGQQGTPDGNAIERILGSGWIPKAIELSERFTGRNELREKASDVLFVKALLDDQEVLYRTLVADWDVKELGNYSAHPMGLLRTDDEWKRCERAIERSAEAVKFDSATWKDKHLRLVDISKANMHVVPTVSGEPLASGST